MIRPRGEAQTSPMSRRRRKSGLALATLILVTLVIGTALALRWQARKAAVGYGMELQSALFEHQAAPSDGQPKPPRDIFNEPKMLAYERALRQPWNLVAFDYLERAEELRTGIVYLHVQLGEPSSLRFARPPKLRHFSLDTGDKSNPAVQRAIRTLMEDYLSSVGSR